MLKRTLQILFQRLNSEEILQKSLHFAPQFDDCGLNLHSFVHLFRHDFPSLTLDQINNIKALLTSNWMKENPNSKSYKYSKRDSLFNVVLRFTENTLTISNNQPACKYDGVLDWHELSMQLGEDIFTTALIAAYDLKHGKSRGSFFWSPYIKIIHTELEALYHRPLTELHAHLRGTSLNFDLNWLCLMNQIQNRSKEFDKFDVRQCAQVSVAMDDYVNDLYHQVIKAAAIRLYLFALTKGIEKDVLECVVGVLKTQSRLEAIYYNSNLQECIECFRQMFGKKYFRSYSSYDIVDYALRKTSADEKYGLVSTLCGERELLYLLMRKCYEGTLSHFQENLLISYLMIKTRFRHEIVQLNDGVGFANFATYEDRKTAFIKNGSLYERLLTKFAVGNFLNEGPDNRYMEVRIVPKENADELLQQIKDTDTNILNDQFGRADGWNYYYIYHFIKSEDRTKNNLLELVPRHYALRKIIERQARAIYKYRNYNLFEGNLRVVGIDAANSEILTRPEVFAQAYRYLRNHSINDNVVNCPKDLKMTFHVGEDFLDVADGLRAYDEVIKFLRFANGDRLGHALALGVDVRSYYKRRNFEVAMPLQIILDNLVWLYEETREIGDPYVLAPQIEMDYEIFYRKIFGNKMSPCSMHTYYKSWLLRGDNPFCYQEPKIKPTCRVSVDEWVMNDLIVDDAEISEAREDVVARVLNGLYHFDRDVKTSGQTVEEYKVSDAFVNTLEIVREKKLNDAEKRQLSIECNPTSNYRIGELSDFSEHPIAKFYNGGVFPEEGNHCLSVSINTDDAGVFSTSIEREYAVMAKAMEKRCCNIAPKKIFDWLDDVRRYGQQQRFVK